MRPIEKIPITDEVIRQLEGLILSGEYQTGDKLPTEAELASALEVGRSTVREATRFLQAVGYVEMRPGKGAYILTTQPINRRADPTHWLRESRVQLEDFLEVRRLLEPFAAKQAARRASPRQLEQLSGVLSAFTEAYSKRDLTRLTFYEEKFHLLIVEAAQNALLVRLYRELLDLLRAYTSHTCALERSFADALEPHRRIFAAIQSRDEDQAEFEMLSHLMLSSRHFQQSALESADRGDDSSHG